MIRFAPPAVPLDAVSSHALLTLAELARLPWVDDPAANVVELAIGDTPGAEPTVQQVAAAPDDVFVIADGRVTIDRALLALVARVAFLLGEQRTTAADRYDRVPASENALAPHGLERTPLVSRVAAALVRAVRRAAGRRPLRQVAAWPHDKRWAAAMTHDLDVVSLWPLFTALRVAELARAGERRQAFSAITAAARAVVGTPVWDNVRRILDVEASIGARSTWFVLSGTPTASTVRQGDLTYRPESPLARRIIGAVVRGGHEIGLHGSFATVGDATRMEEERVRLQRVAAREVTGVRQHFLRARPGATHRVMRDSGFAYDASLGYHDRNGFRLGVADTVAGWDDTAVAPLGLTQVPLMWMDRAMSKYQGNQNPADWTAEGIDLAERCRAEQGLWVGLWHPNLSPALGYPGAPEAFARLMRRLVDSGAWLPTLNEVVRWRQQRAAVRIARVAPDGRYELTTPEGTPADFPMPPLLDTSRP